MQDKRFHWGREKLAQPPAPHISQLLRNKGVSRDLKGERLVQWAKEEAETYQLSLPVAGEAGVGFFGGGGGTHS